MNWTDWPGTIPEAEAMQERLATQVITTGAVSADTALVAGVDVSYADEDRLAAAVVLLDTGTLELVESAVVTGRASFPYRPGLFAFRELPSIVEALATLSGTPGLIVCDGHGLAHPRRFGLACHLGLITGIPAMGVAKNVFTGEFEEPGPHRGATSPLLDGGEEIGWVLRTQDGVKPVFVSAGHLIGLDNACEWALRLTPRYRLPETTRQADHLSRQVLARG
ncbi:deoxyribonuclease V [Pseudonocardiaceae bacterium YIM PH 21723]|nr:deoxyribonuclease V [Pseudonocardiaceae bacterium YIM PH 21723]